MNPASGRCLFDVGKEISYCHTCGHRVDRAFLHDGRRFCETCRPAEAMSEVPIKRQSSTRLRQQPPAPRRETTRIRKRNPVPILVGAAAVIALAIGIAIAAGQSPPPAPPAPSPAAAPAPDPPAPKAPTVPSIDETLARIRELRESDLLYEKRPEIVRMLKDLAGRAGSRLEEVDQVAAEYDRTYEEAAARLADFTRSEAQRMAAKQKLTEAIDRLDGYPQPFQASRAAESIRRLKQDLERRRAEAAPAGGESPRRVL